MGVLPLITPLKQCRCCVSDAAWSTVVDLKPAKRAARGKLHLFTNIAPAHPRSLERGAGFSASVLKSVLQKNVRRRRAMPAVRTAVELLRCHPPREFYRRMSVICIEDSAPHLSLGLFTWLMAAESKGYVAPDELIVMLLKRFTLLPLLSAASTTIPRSLWPSASDVARIPRSVFARVRIAENILSACTSSSAEESDGGVASALLAGLDECEKSKLRIKKEHITMCRSMLLRRAFGGMRGDQRMLCESVLHWMLRFISHAEKIPCSDALCQSGHLCCKVVPAWARSVKHSSDASFAQRCWSQGSIQRGDVCLAGIDFHCCPRMYDQLPRDAMPPHLRTISQDTFRAAMWRYSSSVNARAPLLDRDDERTSSDDDDGTASATWRALAPFVQRWQQRFVAFRLSRQRDSVDHCKRLNTYFCRGILHVCWLINSYLVYFCK